MLIKGALPFSAIYWVQHMFPVIWTYHPLPAQHESRNVISLSLGTSKIPQTEQNDSQTDNTYSIPPVLSNFPLKYYSQWGKESYTD